MKENLIISPILSTCSRGVLNSLILLTLLLGIFLSLTGGFYLNDDENYPSAHIIFWIGISFLCIFLILLVIRIIIGIREMSGYFIKAEITHKL